MREVFGQQTVPLEELYPGMGYLGEVVLPTDDYNIHKISKQSEQPTSRKSASSLPALPTPGHMWVQATGAQMAGSYFSARTAQWWSSSCSPSFAQTS